MKIETINNDVTQKMDIWAVIMSTLGYENRNNGMLSSQKVDAWTAIIIAQWDMKIETVNDVTPKSGNVSEKDAMLSSQKVDMWAAIL